MIQIYSPTNTNFSMNGDSVLFAESCEVHAKLNGEWYLDLSHPLDEEGRWKYIVEEAGISAPTFMGENQLFRIDDVEKGDDGVKAKAYPIFFDSADELFVYSCKPTSVNGQTALNMLTSGTKFSGESNITKTNSAEFINRNLMDCINGDDPAFIRYWGGDVLYDNYKVIINSRAGSNRGFQIRYRRNMDGISRKVDMSNVVTRIVPVAYNGRMITGKYVDSPNIGKYAKVYTRLMEFPKVKLAEDASEEEAEEITVCSTQAQLNTVLTNLCNEQFATGIDLPNITLNVEMVSLSDTEEYKQFANLETVSLGDTVGIYHKDLDISTEERVIEIVWDCIRNKATKLTLGDYEYDYLVNGNKVVMDKAREELQKAIEAWKARYEELKQKYTEVENDVTNLDGSVSDLENDVTEIGGYVGELGTDISDLEDNVTQLEQDASQLEDFVVDELDSIRQELAGAKEDIQDSLDSASGMYTTKQRQSDGSYIYYFHDQSTLASSTNIWKMTSESIAVSVDGGKTYPCGITVNGDAILNLIYAKGISADYITAGKISDATGENYWDLKKGEVNITGTITCKDKIMFVTVNENNGNINVTEIAMGETMFEITDYPFGKNSSGKYVISNEDEIIITPHPVLIFDTAYGLDIGDALANRIVANTLQFTSSYGKFLRAQGIDVCNLKVYNDIAFADGTVMKDYIVEQGISGIWTYEKWNSGILVMCGSVPLNNITTDTEFGSMFRNDTLMEFSSYAYPIKFIKVPCVTATFISTNSTGALVWTAGYSEATSMTGPPMCYLIRPDEKTGITGYIHFNAVGKWK